jgi:NAD(P)-dependent dehydrogenase (short-subunit alcohol dehydrogenase family)
MPRVLITGSGRRLGKKIALSFADLGWDVCLHYNASASQAQETFDILKKKNIKCYLTKCIVSNFVEVNQSLNDVFLNFGVPDVLINNAGVFPEKKSLQDLTADEWQNTIDINLNGAFNFSKIYSEKILNENLKGRIINIASVGGQEIWNQRIPYNVSKAALIQLTKALARDLAPSIQVNAVCPGTVLIEDEPANDSSMISPEKIPMKRFAVPEDIFSAVYFFATCSDFITSQILNVDGGYHNSR